MSPQGRLDYFIENTDKRLEKIEAKLEQLINFRMLLLGGAAVVSGIVSFICLYFGK